MNARVHIRSVITPASSAAWAALAESDPDAVAEQTPKWLEAMQRRGFVDASRLYEFSDATTFVLPMVRSGSSRHLPSHGYKAGWGIGGIVGPGLVPDHVSAVVSDIAQLPTVYTHVRPNPLQAAAWSAADTSSAKAIERCAHVVDLRGGADAVWDRMRSSGRRGVEKAEKAGVEVELHCGGAGLETYYQRLFLPSIRRWAQRQHEPPFLAISRAKRRDPFEKLTTIGRTLGDDFKLYLAVVDGQVAAGNIVVCGPNSHATRAAMNYELGRSTSAAYALEWFAIKDACEAGHRWYQLGETGQNQALADYKERFGAVAIDYYEYRIERLPLLTVDHQVRNAAKRLIGFRD